MYLMSKIFQATAEINVVYYQVQRSELWTWVLGGFQIAKPRWQENTNEDKIREGRWVLRNQKCKRKGRVEEVKGRWSGMSPGWPFWLTDRTLVSMLWGGMKAGT